VESHRQAAAVAASQDGHVDLRLAGLLADACVAMLALWNDLDEPERRAVQAACRYYVWQDDDESDFSSVMGFDDDAAVIAHVAARIGHPEIHPA
jgi:uncharacterized membrane protein YkvA (DUF1232 family)